MKTSAVFTSTDANACFEHFSEVTSSIASPPTFRSDPAIVRLNVAIGVAALLPKIATIAPDDARTIEELPSVALALVVAASRVVPPTSDGEIAARLARIYPIRRLALAQLEVFAGKGLVDAATVAAIRKGTGSYDAALDAVAIAALFEAHAAAFAGKHPFDAGDLATLSRDGSFLVAALLPRNAVRAAPAPDPNAIVRDRIGAYLDASYDVATRVGIAFWGRKRVRDHVPPLQRARVVAARNAGGNGSGTPDAPT